MTRLDLKYLNKKPEKMYICTTYAPLAYLGEEGMRAVGTEEHLRKERTKINLKNRTKEKGVERN